MSLTIVFVFVPVAFVVVISVVKDCYCDVNGTLM